MNIINLQDKNLYYIGGVVRDELLGKECFDIDLIYQGNAIEFTKELPNAEILQINEPFGTVKIKFEDKEIDIASTRCETYPQKGHLPEVNNIGCSLKDDILRRDFTINALAKSTITGEIIDFTNGLQDLKNKTLRVLHDKSFIDDPTRILRGLKFSVRFGFELDSQTKELQDKYLKSINYDISYKRLKKELVETFNLNSWTAFEKFINDGIYKLITPQEFILPEINLEELIKQYKPACPWIIYIGLLPDISSLPLTKTEQKIVDDYKKLNQEKFDSDYEIYKVFERINLESILMFATINSEIVTRYLNTLQYIKPVISGKDLQNIGIPPSKKYTEIFDYILREKLKNPALDKTQEIELAKNFYFIP
uniref:Poly A polymerase head domain-containing protein n=1 Tax=uncultured Candidatus Melainabacteria bacterium TaxID=2682970 RepID=A0A650EKL7_9BACT|nr:hypothetical protein Melaina855_0450 [uncultured Candidatus Melainabacteria bacterium]